MSNPTSPLPDHYKSTLRTLVKYAVVMAFVALLTGVSFQESSKKVPWGSVESAAHSNATLKLALVHGHVMVVAFLIPIAMAGLLLIARHAGGADLSTRPLRWLTCGYLPMAALTLVLMLWKGYHRLLQIRGGTLDMEAIHDEFFFGLGLPRIIIYGVIHTAMSVSLCVFLVAVWRSFRTPS